MHVFIKKNLSTWYVSSTALNAEIPGKVILAFLSLGAYNLVSLNINEDWYAIYIFVVSTHSIYLTVSTCSKVDVLLDTPVHNYQKYEERV